MDSLTFVVVDDAVFMRTVLKNILVDAGHEVIAEAGNGLEAIQVARAVQPDMMTLDMSMPEMDGLQAIEGILEVSPHTRIIMCSAMGQQTRVLEAIKKGAKDFIIKPFEKTRVLQAVSKVSGL